MTPPQTVDYLDDTLRGNSKYSGQLLYIGCNDGSGEFELRPRETDSQTGREQDQMRAYLHDHGAFSEECTARCGRYEVVQTGGRSGIAFCWTHYCRVPVNADTGKPTTQSKEGIAATAIPR